MTKRPVLREASVDDYDQIAPVGQTNGLPSERREQWLHLWKSNPAYHQIPDRPIGWVLEDSSGGIVGSILNVPCLYRFGGGGLTSLDSATGWAVDLQYRAFSLSRFVLTSTAGPKTSAVLAMHGWSRVPVGQWDRSALWVTSYAQTVRRHLRAKTPHVLSAIAGPLLYLHLSVKDFMSASWRTSAAG